MINFDSLPSYRAKAVKELIEKNIVYIEEGDWITVYNNVPIKHTNGIQATFTAFMYQIDLDPLSSSTSTPEYFLSGSCKEFDKFSIPPHIRCISKGAFSHATQLITCNIPDSVEVIESQVFDQCHKLKNLSLGRNIKEIHSNCFTRCDSLKQIVYNNTTQAWSSVIKHPDWKSPRKRIKIICLDGEVIE